MINPPKFIRRVNSGGGVQTQILCWPLFPASRGDSRKVNRVTLWGGWILQGGLCSSRLGPDSGNGPPRSAKYIGLQVHNSTWVCLEGETNRHHRTLEVSPGQVFVGEIGMSLGQPSHLSSPQLNLKVRQIMWFQLRLASFNLKVKVSLQRRETCMNWNWN